MSAENVDAVVEAKIDGAAFSNQTDLTISIQYQLTSQALLDLIQKGQARYAVQVTCSSTFKRELYLLHEQDFLTLPAGEYSKELTITPYVIATADIAGFIAEQYAVEIRAIREGKTEGFDLRTGTILALGDQTRITLDETQGSPDSVIDLVSNKQTTAGSFQIDIEGNRLEIHVNPEDKKKIETLRQQGPNSTEQAALYPALYLHAVAEALRNLPDYPDTNWAQTLRKSLELRQIDVEDEELKSNSLQYAQELMERPMERMLTAFINRDEQKYPVFRLTQDAYNALRQESENNPELYQDPHADFHEVLRTHGITDSVEETKVFAQRPIHLTPVTTNPRNRADAQALDFYNSLVGMTPSLAIDGRMWAWMTHFKLHSYCLERWPLRRNTNLTQHSRRHWFVENTGNALWQSNAASRTWWIAHTAFKAARESGGAFTAEQALEDFAHYPEHYHTLMNYNFTRHPLVLAEFIRTLLNEAQGINRAGVRQLGRRLNLTGGTRLLDAIPREQLRAHIVTKVEEIMSDADLVSDRKRLRMNPTRVLSLGAGVQSTVLALLADRGAYDLPRPDFAIFADTGWEPPAVYEHLEWLKAQLSYEVITVSDGNIRDDILNGTNPDGQKFLDIPAFLINADGKNSVAARQCTSHYKLRPIHRYLREYLGIPHGRRARKETHVEMWLGISADEDLRQKPSPYEWITNRYPLIQLQFSRAQLLNWFKSHYPDRDLPASSCIGCPYHSNSMWKQLKESDPASFKDAVFIDQALRNVPVTRGTIKGTAFLHRARIPLDEVDFSDVTNYDDLMLNECEGLCGI